MSTELGVAYVSIVPSLKGVSPAITAQLQGAKSAFDGVATQIETRAKRMQQSVADSVGRAATAIDRKFGEAAMSVSADLGETAGAADGAAKAIQDSMDGAADKIAERFDAAAADITASLAEVDAAAKTTSDNVSNAGGSGAGGMGLLKKAIIGLSPAIASVTPAVAGLGLGIVGATGAGIVGVGAFTLAMKPLLTTIKTVSTAQDAYTKAVAEYGPKSKEAETALKKLNSQMAALSPAQRRATGAWEGFKASFTQWGESNSASTIPVFVGGLNDARKGLSLLSPVVRGASKGLTTFVKDMGSVISAKSTKSFFADLGGQSAKSIGALSGFLKGVATYAMRAMKDLDPLTGTIDKLIGSAGRSIGSANPAGWIGKLTAQVPGGVKTLKDLWSIFKSLLQVVGPFVAPLRDVAAVLADQLAKTAKVLAPVLKPIVADIGQIARSMGGALALALKAATPLLVKFFDYLDNHPGVTKMIVTVSLLALAAKKVAGPLATAAKGVKGMMTAFKDAEGLGKLTALISPEGLIVLGILAVAAAAYEIVKHWGPISKFFEDVWRAINNNFVKPIVNFFTGTLVNVMSGVWKFMKRWGPVALAAIDPFIGIPLLIWQHWKAIKGYLTDAWDAAKKFLSTSWGLFVKTARDAWNAITTPIRNIWNDIFGSGGAVRSAWNSVAGFLRGVWRTFTNTARGAWNSITSPIRNLWDGLFGRGGTVRGAWTNVSGWFVSTWNGFENTVDRIWKRITGGISGAWKALKTDAKDVWKDVAGAFKNGINTITGDIDKWFISPVNVALKLVGVHIPSIPKMASGGTVGAGFMTNGPRAIVGEGRPQHPEFVIPTDPQYRGNAMSLMAQAAGMMGLPMFAGGGVIGKGWRAITGAISSGGSAAFNALKSAAHGLEHWVGGALSHVLNPVARGVEGMLGKIKPGMVGNMAAGTVKLAASDIGKWVNGLGGGTQWLALLKDVKQWLGVPYLYGGESMKGVDCSGLIQALYHEIGVNLGRTTVQQEVEGKQVGVPMNFGATKPLIRPGDALFYQRPGASGTNAHVVMYLGNNEVVQAPHTGAYVEKSPLFAAADASEPFYTARRYLGAAPKLPSVGSLTGGGSPSANRSLGQRMAAAMGWTGLNWADLVQLWNRESGWSNTARNPSSGAYGIPQALPPTKLPFAGQAAGGSQAGPQIQWGLNYIAGRYGNPGSAWAHETSAGWYKSGGVVGHKPMSNVMR